MYKHADDEPDDYEYSEYSNDLEEERFEMYINTKVFLFSICCTRVHVDVKAQYGKL